MESKGLIEWIKEINPVRCDSSAAWEGRDLSVEQHYSCTQEIAKSDNLISTIMYDIEDVSKLEQVIIEKLIDEIWLMFENMTLQEQQEESKDFKKIFTLINDLVKDKSATNYHL